MENEVFINSKGFIEVRVCNVLTIPVAVTIGYKVLQLSSQLEKNNLPTIILLDSSCVKSWSPDANKMVEIILKNIEMKKVATFGANDAVKAAHHKIISNTHKEDVIKVFSTRESAEKWLMES